MKLQRNNRSLDRVTYANGAKRLVQTSSTVYLYRFESLRLDLSLHRGRSFRPTASTFQDGRVCNIAQLQVQSFHRRLALCWRLGLHLDLLRRARRLGLEVRREYHGLSPAALWSPGF